MRLYLILMLLLSSCGPISQEDLDKNQGAVASTCPVGIKTPEQMMSCGYLTPGELVDVEEILSSSDNAQSFMFMTHEEYAALGFIALAEPTFLGEAAWVGVGIIVVSAGVIFYFKQNPPNFDAKIAEIKVAIQNMSATHAQENNVWKPVEPVDDEQMKLLLEGSSYTLDDIKKVREENRRTTRTIIIIEDDSPAITLLTEIFGKMLGFNIVHYYNCDQYLSGSRPQALISIMDIDYFEYIGRTSVAKTNLHCVVPLVIDSKSIVIPFTGRNSSELSDLPQDLGEIITNKNYARLLQKILDIVLISMVQTENKGRVNTKAVSTTMKAFEKLRPLDNPVHGLMNHDGVTLNKSRNWKF